MKRLLSYLLVALAAVGLGLGIARAMQPPAANDIRLPLVANGPASICDGSPLLDTDVGAISAIRDADGNYDVAIQDRSHGSRAHIMRHVGGHLEELAEPQQAAPSTAPAFSPPGPKQGALALVAGLPGEKSRLYYTERDQDDTSGPYKPRCLEF